MNKFLKILLVINILTVDLVLGYLFLNGSLNRPNSSEQFKTETREMDQLSSDSCGEECQKYIQNAIDNIQKSVSITVTPTRALVSNQTSTTPKVKNISYIPIPGSGISEDTNWKTLTGTDFYFKKSDYPGLTGIYFEVNMRLLNGNGTSYVRLYDLTNSIGVQGSEISTNSQTSTFVGSGMLYPWEGNNHYVVQAKSLTADSAVFESGRLKIITEN